MENIGTIVLATGALGTAAFGIVEALKWTRIGFMGFSKIVDTLGPIWGAMVNAYGKDFEQVLRGQYKGNLADLVRTLRQGIRIGLSTDNAAQISDWLGLKHGDKLQAVAAKLEASEDITDEEKNVLGRFELAVDARIDAAMALAENDYVGKLRVLASCAALIIALAVGYYLDMMFLGVVVGIAAVPFAPIAKDLTAALQAAVSALKR